MNPRTKRLLLTLTGVLVATALFLGFPAPADRLPTQSPVGHSVSPPLAATISPTPDAAALSPAERGMHTYAVDISWLMGFPPDAQPGDVFDIWVAWDQRVVKGPNIQLLLKEVVLEKIAPPVTPAGPYVAFLFMTREQSRDFLYGKEYGSLSVTRPTA